MISDHIAWLYTLNDHVLKVNTEGLTEGETLRRPTPGGNCANWVVGHLLRSRKFLLEFLECDWALPDGAAEVYHRGSSGDDDGRFIPFPELRRMWEETHGLLMKALAGLTDEQLAAEVQPLGDFSKPDTRLRRILFLYFHETYHLGQLGLLRRLLGREGAIK